MYVAGHGDPPGNLHRAGHHIPAGCRIGAGPAGVIGSHRRGRRTGLCFPVFVQIDGALCQHPGGAQQAECQQGNQGKQSFHGAPPSARRLGSLALWPGVEKRQIRVFITVYHRILPGGRRGQRFYVCIRTAKKPARRKSTGRAVCIGENEKNYSAFLGTAGALLASAGRLKVNRHHLPSSLSTRILPPDRLMSTLQMCSPSPDPRVLRPRERSSL